jgi:hypothetical protein
VSGYRTEKQVEAERKRNRDLAQREHSAAQSAAENELREAVANFLALGCDTDCMIERKKWRPILGRGPWRATCAAWYLGSYMESANSVMSWHVALGRDGLFYVNWFQYAGDESGVGDRREFRARHQMSAVKRRADAQHLVRLIRILSSEGRVRPVSRL